MSRKLVLIGIGIVFLLLIWSGISIYPDLLWFENLGFAPVFWTMLLSRFGFGFIVWLILIIGVYINIRFARRFNPPGRTRNLKETDAYTAPFGLSERTLNTILLGFILILTLVMASRASNHWNTLLRYLYQEPFGTADPVLQKDIGFYIFSLPFYIFIRDGLQILVILVGLITVGWYLKNGALAIEGDFTAAEGAAPSLPKIYILPEAKRHLVFLCGIIVILLAWGYYLKVYGLMYSRTGVVFGAGFTDVHVKVLAYRIMIFICLGFAAVLFINSFKFNAKQLWISAAIWFGAVILFSNLLPLAFQNIIVKPNELARESTYLSHNIKHTQKAYHLENVEQVDFDVSDQLSLEDISTENATIKNIRIWDERPLLQTYRQIQAIRLYYNFNNVDVDRYRVKDEYRQVMLAAREMMIDQLPPTASTWVNRHLIYTHGHGLTLSPVNEVSNEGLPNLFVKDLPPIFEPGLEIDRPEIYHGEKTSEYVIVNTKTPEFDYPMGEKNVYTQYQGDGGVPINSFLRKILFSVEFMDPQILFTTYLKPESRIMYNRRVHVRSKLIAPFLDFDSDPYIAVSRGKLYWVLDAYTTSDMYPYSFRSSGSFNKVLNYIRNSVKVTIDAFNGNVEFYIIDDTDPIVKTYSRIFPDLFKPFSEMPEDLKKHIRYPKDLFKIQTETYTKYHMEDIQVFYNQEDLWQIPDELYGDSRQKVEPYFVVTKLPGDKKEEFILMTPYTPSKKDNMIGWFAARCDMPDYGNLVVYKLPKDKLVYGPMQIEARIDQQTEISREFSLWTQRGSRVIRGNLLAIPIKNTFIYVEPVYLEAIQEQKETKPAETQQPRSIFSARKPAQSTAAGQPSKESSLPELKRVIVAFSNRLAMAETLDEGLKEVLGGQVSFRQEAVTPVPLAPPVSTDDSNLGIAALESYNRARDYLRQGNWAEYGRELENLEEILKKMSGVNQGIQDSAHTDKDY